MEPLSVSLDEDLNNAAKQVEVFTLSFFPSYIPISIYVLANCFHIQFLVALIF